MDWRWSDLEIGDIIRINKKLCKRHSREDWILEFGNRELEIIKINKRNIKLDIFVDFVLPFIVIEKTGECHIGRDGCPLFEIVKLKDD